MSKRLLLLFLAACAAPSSSDPQQDEVDLPIGEVENELDAKWGYALECKPIPTQYEQLKHPRIIISIQGLTLHLIDEESGYDKVFPMGSGKIEKDENEPSFGESLSYYPVLATQKNDFKLRASTNVACKTMWTDPETGKKSPVFAGLPFMPFYGSYAIHGPIDNFTAPNGGNLFRGFVSHGCVRMEAQDVLEVYARVGRLPEVPVHVQREPERASDGTRVDAPNRWIGAECATDTDCNFDGGFCHANPIGGRGYCSKRCTSTCPDRPRTPRTFCVADPADTSLGMCVVKVEARNDSCRTQDHMLPKTTRRFKSTTTANVCMPGTRGWIGDHCAIAADCQMGNTCTAGVCTQSCSGACPDLPGTPWTTCVSAADLGGNTCARVCTQASNGSECSAGYTCESRPRASDNSKTKTVCTPE